jgi:hypothetical protein
MTNEKAKQKSAAKPPGLVNDRWPASNTGWSHYPFAVRVVRSGDLSTINSGLFAECNRG